MQQIIKRHRCHQEIVGGRMATFTLTGTEGFRGNSVNSRTSETKPKLLKPGVASGASLLLLLFLSPVNLRLLIVLKSMRTSSLNLVQNVNLKIVIKLKNKEIIVEFENNLHALDQLAQLEDLQMQSQN